MSFRTRISGALSCFALMLASHAALAQDNDKRGFDAESVYFAGEIDTVSLFTGGLSVVIPIGTEYPVNANLTYGLSLVYNGKLWDYERFQNSDPGSTAQTVAIPTKDVNAGFGWSLNPGFLVPPHFSENLHEMNHWQYVSPDGARHYFYPTLHQEDANADPDILYTRDNTYLRLDLSSVPFTVEFPNGEIHEFGYEDPASSEPWSRWYVTSIQDVFEASGLDTNRVDFSYGVKGSTWVWTIDDSHARTHTVTLAEFTDIEPSSYYVVEVDLAAFDGGRAIYTFDYSYATQIEAGCGATYPETQHDVRFLTRLTLPDGSFYDLTDGTLPRYLTYCGGSGESGALTGIRLPTRGQIEWDYASIKVPLWNNDADSDTYPQTVTRGVRNRRTLDEAGNVLGNWSYWHELVPAEPYNPGQPRPREMRVHLTDPTGFCTTHYFDANPGYENPLEDSNPNPGWSYGLPFSWEEPMNAGLHLSSQVYDGKDGLLCGQTLLRSTYVKYEHDRLPPAVMTQFTGPLLQGWNDTNRRLQASRTIYHDDGDTFASVTHTRFDGLGNYRTTVHRGDFTVGDGVYYGAAANEKVAFTEYSPGVQQYVSQAGWTPPALSDPWILGEFDQQEIGMSFSIELCHDSNGLVKRRRRYANGTSHGANDTLALFDYDAAGNRVGELYYGGYRDGILQTIDTSGTCSIDLFSPQYEIRHEYSFGARSRSYYVDFGTPMTFNNFEATIDPATGLPSATYDISGIRTDHKYDSMGRRTYSMPEPGQGAGSKVSYWPATGSLPARVLLETIPNGTPHIPLPPSPDPIDPGPGTPGAYSARYYVFDGLGRLVRESRKMPDESWSHRETRYDSRSNESFVSEWSAVLPAPFGTEFKERDAFGRPGRITPPDGPSHDVVLTYAGDRVVNRTVAIGTGVGIETPVTTQEIYDRFGRLWSVTEPSQPNGDPVETAYWHDDLDRLRRVDTYFLPEYPGDTGSEQTRWWEYDDLGNLIEQTHPEKNNTPFYSGHYDARGNPGYTDARVIGGQPPSEGVVFTYDRAERVVEVREQSGLERLVKSFTYASENDLGGAGDYSKGKLVSAERGTYAPDATEAIKETYVYGGVGGAVSERATWLGGTKAFNLSAAWHETGRLASLTYPSCVASLCAGAGEPARTVTHDYDQDRLTAIPGYASSIAYHPNGMLASVAHTNGVTDTWEPDPWGMGRPRKIQSAPTSVYTFDTGTFAYDGVGNITEIGNDTFSYDQVSRISSAQIGGSFFDYEYDALGNRLDIGSDRFQITPISNRYEGRRGADGGEGVVAYDYWGRLSRWGTFRGYDWEYDNHYTHDVLGMKTQHDFYEGYRWGSCDGSSSRPPQARYWYRTYAYDASDKRMREFRKALAVCGEPPPPVAIWRLRDLEGRVIREFLEIDTDGDHQIDSWEWVKDTVWREGTLLAASVSGESFDRHYHTDHLGSLRLVTGPGGQGLTSFRLGPFGEEIVPGSEETRFTGHERDYGGLSGFGDLDYMGARYASPKLGRFLSPDPIETGKLAVPQSWNKYAYVMNNPLKYVDPDGQDARVVWEIGSRDPVPVAQQRAAASVRSEVRTELAFAAAPLSPAVLRRAATLFRLGRSQGALRVGRGLHFRTVGDNPRNIKILKGRNSRGFTSVDTDLTGGRGAAIERFENLTGVKIDPGSPADQAVVLSDGSRVGIRFKADGTTKLDLRDVEDKTLEKITFSPE